MNATPVESIPQTWNDNRDAPFFSITADLFSAEFCWVASLLLGSFDAVDNAPAAPSVDTQERVLAVPEEIVPVPVRVRRPR
jgi:hypothetical protein